MSRSLDQSRPFRAGRHRAAAAPVITTPVTPTSSDAEASHPGHSSTETASAPLRRRRDRRPAFDVPPAPESGRPSETASPATEAIPAIAPMGSAPESPRRAVAPGSGPATALSPQVAAAFSSDARAILKRAASVRVVGHRMAVVAGSLAVLLAVGTASQATELPFFGKESSAQDAPGATDATGAASGTQPTGTNGRATPRSGAANAPGTPGAAPAQAAPGTDNVPAATDPTAASVAAVADLPMPVDAPTLAGILADSPAAVAPSPTPTVILQPPVISSATPAPPASPAAAAPAPTTTPPAATPTATPTPVAASPAPSPTGTAAPSEEGDGTTDEAVDTRSYASARLASYGWGAEQMNALNVLWDTSAKWRPSQVDRGLGYIKERYGSPAKALEFRAANNWY